MMNKKWFVRIILFLFIGASVYYFFIKNHTFFAESESMEIFSLQNNVNQYRNCLNKSYDDNVKKYDIFIQSYRKCVEKHVGKKVLDKFRMGRYGEDKVFIPLKSTFNQDECLWLTVGIGGDDEVEKAFKQKYPKCQIFGVEPSSDQYANFSAYGTVIPHGVGVKDGNATLTLRIDSTYYNKTVKVFAFSKLLDKFVKSRFVHYMTIDIEGFEYGILEALLPSKKLYKEGVTFCQIDAELHSNVTKIQDILHKFDAENSPYLPIYSKKFLIHEKVTWINIKDKRCRQTFDVENFV